MMFRLSRAGGNLVRGGLGSRLRGNDLSYGNNANLGYFVPSSIIPTMRGGVK